MIGKILSVLLLAAPVAMPALAAELSVVGWVERVVINPGSLSLRAKLDTGAKTSSLNAADMTFVTRDGRRWVRFQITNGNGHIVKFERPVVRQAKLRRTGADSETRPGHCQTKSA